MQRSDLSFNRMAGPGCCVGMGERYRERNGKGKSWEISGEAIAVI